MIKVGIEEIGVYYPQLKMSLQELAVARDIEFGKLNKGLGLTEMSVPDSNEDAVTFGANAVYALLEQSSFNLQELGRLYLGTESAVDGAKPTATYIAELIEQKYGERSLKNCDVVDMTFACIGAVDALQNALDYVRLNPSKKAIVVASDYAKYDLASPGEYTQGAGAVALLIAAQPKLFIIDNTWGVAFESVGDFFKPKLKIEENGKTYQVLKDEPVFDGPYSNLCYTQRVDEALANYQDQSSGENVMDWKSFIFHLPYAFQGRRMFANSWYGLLSATQRDAVTAEIGAMPEENEALKVWQKSLVKSNSYRQFVQEKITQGETLSGRIGNVYTASIFTSLVSWLCGAHSWTKGDKIGFLAYGSGSKSKVFSASVESAAVDWRFKDVTLNTLSQRVSVDFEQYVALHKAEVDQPLSFGGARLESILDQKNKEGYRIYKWEE